MILEPKVSVICITYNQEKFIRKALESFLIQKTDFFFEVIIGEDCSTDKTKEIIIEFENAYPKIFKPIYREKNLGTIENFVNVLKRTRGDYIALCEGDDYWTDPLKLQKQVNFLEKNPDYSMCFHEADVIGEEGFIRKFNDINEDRDFKLLDLTQSNFISTASVVFRKKNIEKIPPLFFRLDVGDWALHLLNAQKGKIRYFKDCMSVYRQHEGGMWSSLGNNEMVLKGVELMKQLDKAFGYQYHEQFKAGIEKRLQRLKESSGKLLKN